MFIRQNFPLSFSLNFNLYSLIVKPYSFNVNPPLFHLIQLYQSIGYGIDDQSGGRVDL